MPPQPLSRVRPGVKITSGVDCFKRRPEIAVLVAECLHAWSWVELQTAQLYVSMCRGNHERAAEYFCALESSKAKNDAIRVLALNSLSERDFEIVSALLRYIKSQQSIRDRMAHWIWNISDELPNDVFFLIQRKL